MSFSTAEEAGSSKKNSGRQSQEVGNSNEVVTHRKGKRPLSAAKATEDLQIKRRRLEIYDPALLQREVWWHLDQLFGPRTQVESRRLKWGDISLEEDLTTGNEMLVLKAECSSKTHRASELVGQTSADTTNQCPVDIYKQFQSHRPKEMTKPDSPFYLAVKQRRKPSQTVWYMKRPLAVYKIGEKIDFDPKQQTMDSYLYLTQ